MLSREYRLRLCEILYRIKLQRTVTLEERIWMHKLLEHNAHARSLAQRIL